MKTVARLLELSIASNDPNFRGGAALRRQEIETITNPLRRLGALGIDELAARKPTVAKSALDKLARATVGLEFVGYGADYSVYGDGKTVTKVNRASVNWSEQARQRYVEDNQRATQLLCETMGDMAIDQVYQVGQHPLGIYRAVIATQTYVHGEALPVFNTNRIDINPEVVAAYCELAPQGEAALQKVVEDTHRLYDDQSLVPDTNGSGNLVVVGPESSLTLIDPQPMSGNELTGLIMQQVDALSKFLEAA